MNMKRRKWWHKSAVKQQLHLSWWLWMCACHVYLDDNIIHRKWFRSRCAAAHKLNKFIIMLDQLQLHYFLLFQLLLQSVSGGHLQVRPVGVGRQSSESPHPPLLFEQAFCTRLGHCDRTNVTPNMCPWTPIGPEMLTSSLVAALTEWSRPLRRSV